jgi:hypothetical protein
VEVGGVRACKSIILAEPRAARFAGIAAFSSLLPKEAGFGTYLEAGPLSTAAGWVWEKVTVMRSGVADHGCKRVCGSSVRF